MDALCGDGIVVNVWYFGRYACILLFDSITRGLSFQKFIFIDFFTNFRSKIFEFISQIPN